MLLLKRNKTVILVILGLLIIILLSLYLTMAFLGPVKPEPAKTEFLTTSSKSGSLVLNKGEVLQFPEKQILASTTPSVTLTSDDQGSNISLTYDVYLEITSNTLIYTTEEKKAELLLRVYDHTDTEITSIPGLNYVTTEENYKGFDITNLTGKVPISIDYLIETNNNTTGLTHTWKFEIQFIDLLNEQIDNHGNAFKANIIFEGEELEEIIADKIINDNGTNTLLDSKDIRNYRLSSTSTSFYDSLTPEAKIYYDYSPGLYKYTEDAQTHYIYRGAAVNNWVYFANHYWRIVKINHDNSVKLIYSGTTAPSSSDIINKTTDTNIGTSIYNSDILEAESTGYMYTLTQRDGNTTSSSVKTVLDTWYEDNLLSYESFIKDEVYCSDRSINNNVINGLSGAGTGIGQTLTYFGSTSFISSKQYVADGNLSLECAKNDSFTVDDSVNGNSALAYPIGLLTSYEAVAAGLSINAVNSGNYLYTGSSYYTMSPYSGGTTNEIFIVDNEGKLSKSLVNQELDIRPVITLDSAVKVIGSGYYNEPYTVIGG